METVVDDNSTCEGMSAVEIQQQYFDNIGECDWTRYELANREQLLQNIAFAMFGKPGIDGDLANSKVALQGYTSRQTEQVMKIFNMICEQGKYSLNNADIYLSVIIVVCCVPRPLKFYQLEPTLYWCDLHHRKDIIMWHTAVFKIRKCIPPVSGRKGCRLYIDEDARVYHSWAAYLENNTLPKCVMVLPVNGEYTGTQKEDGTATVDLSVVPSPALGPAAKVLRIADNTTTAASLGSLAVFGAALFTPVAPVALAGAAAAMVATGVYGTIRSGCHLADRKKHEQTLCVTDAEARGSWINIVGSTVAIAAGASTKLLSQSAAAGTNMTRTGLILQKSVDVCRYASLVTGTGGLVNSLALIVTNYHKHGEKPSTLEIFQFTASTLFFFNAVVSNKTAQKIVEEVQTKSLNDYSDGLRSNRHRKMFNKMAAESRRTRGFIEGNTEVIRGIRNIANKDQYFADVLRVNKDINANKLRVSISADGSVNINDRHSFNPGDLAGLSKEERTQLFTKLGVPDTTVKNVPTKPNAFPTVTANPGFMIVRAGEIIRFGSMIINLTQTSEERIVNMLHELSKDVSSALINLVLNVVNCIVPEEMRKLKIFNPDNDIIVEAVRFVFDFLKSSMPNDASNVDEGIKSVLTEFFEEGCVRKETLRGLVRNMREYINRKFDAYMDQYPNRIEIICNNCQGTTYFQ